MMFCVCVCFIYIYINSIRQCSTRSEWRISQIAMFMGPTLGPPGSYQMGPMLDPWTLLWGIHQPTWPSFVIMGLSHKCSMPCHDGVIKWKHFPCYWSFVGNIHRSSVDSPHKGHWRGTLICFLRSAPEPTVKQITEMPVIWEAIALIMTPL